MSDVWRAQTGTEHFVTTLLLCLMSSCGEKSSKTQSSSKSTGKSPDPRLNPLQNAQPNVPSQPPQNVLIIICRVEDQLKARLRGSFRGANLIIYLFKTNCLGFNSPECSIPKGFWEENEVGRLKQGDTLSLPIKRTENCWNRRHLYIF